MVLEILMVVPVAGLYCSGGLRISIVGCSVGARGGWYHWHIVMLWHFPLGLVWGIPQFFFLVRAPRPLPTIFFSCAGTKAPPAAKMPWGKCRGYPTILSLHIQIYGFNIGLG